MDKENGKITNEWMDALVRSKCFHSLMQFYFRFSFPLLLLRSTLLPTYANQDTFMTCTKCLHNEYVTDKKRMRNRKQYFLTP